MPVRIPPKVELDRQAFAEFKRARMGLAEALGVEERFNMLLGNYAEFESELLQQSLHHLMFDDLEWARNVEVIHTFNRRLNNLLSTCRLYLDQTARTLHKIYPDDDRAFAAFETARHDEYDAAFAYRLMEALRNYAQHRSLPVTHISVENGNFPGHEAALAHHQVVPSLDLEQLRGDPKFKRAVLHELEATAEGRYVDIRMPVRKYIEGLGRVHGSYQHAISPDLAAWDTMMVGLRSRFESMWDGARWSYVVVSRERSEGEAGEEAMLVEDAITRRVLLARRNQYVSSYSRQVVSNFAGTSA